MSAESQSKSFHLQTAADGTRRTLALSGELDALVASDVEDAVRRLCDEGIAELVLDLRDLTFIDSTGLRSTLIAYELCQECGHDFAVIPGPRQVQALFELTGLAGLLPFQSGGEPPTPLQDGLLSGLFVPPAAEGPAG
jgi:anti-anti-sigma factor